MVWLWNDHYFSSDFDTAIPEGLFFQWSLTSRVSPLTRINVPSTAGKVSEHSICSTNCFILSLILAIWCVPQSVLFDIVLFVILMELRSNLRKGYKILDQFSYLNLQISKAHIRVLSSMSSMILYHTHISYSNTYSMPLILLPKEQK